MNLLFCSFWIIAIPVMSIITPTFMWPDIVHGYHHIKKRALARRIMKARPSDLFICSDVLTRNNHPLRGSKSSKTAIFVATLGLSQTGNLLYISYPSGVSLILGRKLCTNPPASVIYIPALGYRNISGITFKYTHSLEQHRDFGSVYPFYHHFLININDMDGHIFPSLFYVGSRRPLLTKVRTVTHCAVYLGITCW